MYRKFNPKYQRKHETRNPQNTGSHGAGSQGTVTHRPPRALRAPRAPARSGSDLSEIDWDTSVADDPMSGSGELWSMEENSPTPRATPDLQQFILQGLYNIVIFRRGFMQIIC